MGSCPGHGELSSQVKSGHVLNTQPGVRGPQLSFILSLPMTQWTYDGLCLGPGAFSLPHSPGTIILTPPHGYVICSVTSGWPSSLTSWPWCLACHMVEDRVGGTQGDALQTPHSVQWELPAFRPHRESRKEGQVSMGSKRVRVPTPQGSPRG